MEIQVTGCKTCPFCRIDEYIAMECEHPTMHHPSEISGDIFNNSKILTGCPLLIDVITVVLTNYKQPKL